MATALRPLTLGELLDRVFHLYRNNLILFAGLAGMPYAVVLALQLATLDFQNTPLTLGWAVTIPLLALAGFTANGFVQAGTVYAVSQLYLGRGVSISEAYSQILPRVFMLCLMTVVLGIAIMLGILALVLPGLYLLLRWALVVPAMIIERKSMTEAMGRSAFLMTNQYGRAFLVYVLFFIITAIFTAFFQVPATIAVLTSPVPGMMPTWAQVLVQAGGFLANTFLGPLLTIAISLLYYDGRVRKEAFDLEHMTTLVEAGPVSAPAI